MKGLMLFLTLFIAGGAFFVSAQDLIVLRDGTIIEAKVVEISPTEIRYKRFDHLDGPTIVIPASEVLSIRYENGSVERFETAPAEAAPPPAVQKETQANKPQANNAQARRYALDPSKAAFGISFNPAGFIPFSGGGPSLSIDVTKRYFLFKMDIRSGLGFIPSFYGSEWFGLDMDFNGFIPSRIGGFYIGGMLGYSVGEAYNRKEESSYTVHSFNLAGNIGYVFITRSGMYFRTGFTGGYSFGAWSPILRPDVSVGYNFGGRRPKGQTAPTASLSASSAGYTPSAQDQSTQSYLPSMVYIDGGSFTMGSPADEVGRRNDETQLSVTISPFYMGKYEVTQNEYQEIMGRNPSRFKGALLPVERVSWFDAVEYCNRLSAKEGLSPAYIISGSGAFRTVSWDRSANGYRLPTEAEWEYACRAGTATAYNTGANISYSQARFSNNGTAPVGSYAPNAWGLYDMHGNVQEWCWDWYGAYPYAAQTNPVGASWGSERVNRGGRWGNSTQDLRSAQRFRDRPSYRVWDMGFRLVRSSFG